MKKFYLILMAALVITGVGCSDKDEKSEQTSDARLTKLSQSECKTNGTDTRAEEAVNSLTSLYGEQSIDYTFSGGVLQLTHINAVYGCDAEDVGVSAKVQGNVIVVTEENLQSLANCVCPIDLGYKVAPLNAGKYTVVVMRGTLELVRFAVELKEGVKGNVPLGE